MKVPYSWLVEHAPLQQSPEEVAETLIRLGHEVEGVEYPRRAVRGVRVGRILTKCKHPNADRLSLLSVDIGEAEPLAIVCGATNMDEGDKVPVATVGARLPNGLVIKKGRIRGETSCGMCCSETELGLAEESVGLMILPEDAPVGAEVGEYLGLEEAVFDLSITPNRGDCMSVRGLARDLAADAGLPLAPLELAAPDEDAAIAAPEVRLEAGEDCPLYLARRIEGVRVGESPEWMQRRLMLAGMRPVNGIVDVLNYVMLDIGQPMHAFDAARVHGGITARPARANEAFRALDGRELALNAGDLVIADEKGVIALAGIMGSEDSGVTESTTAVVLESAFFRPARISETRRVHAMVSEASMRFERGVDPAMVEAAMTRAAGMIVSLFGGRAGPVRQAGDAGPLLARRRVTCSVAAIEARLGVPVPTEADAVLARMGFDVTRDGDALEVAAPPFRHDVSLPEDIAEEYARIIGFDAIPERLPPLAPSAAASREAGREAIHRAARLGFAQVITYAFIAEGEQRLFAPADGADVRLANPISDAMQVMRRSLWPGLLVAARHNLNRQMPGVALAEIGRVYARGGQGIEEREMLALLMAGEVEPAQWFAPARQADFFDIKGAVEAWLALAGLQARFIADDDLAGLRPGQSARILVGRAEVGRLGRVDDAAAERFGIEAPAFVAELELARLPGARRPKFAPLPEFPGVERDLVFLFDRDVRAEDVLAAARKAGGSLLADARIFDRYAGQGVPEGKVSLGVRFTLQAPDRTLTQAESDAVSDAIVAAMEQRFGASLRA